MEKEITNQELLNSINRSFSKLEEKMATKEDLKKLKTELETKIDTVEINLSSKIAGLDRRMDTQASEKVSYEEFGKLKLRVDKIEVKAV